MKFVEKLRGAVAGLPRRLTIAAIGAALLPGLVSALGGLLATAMIALGCM